MERNRRHHLGTFRAGFRRLTRATLADAVECIASGTRRQATNELAWVTASEPNGPFTFDGICFLHGISADVLRKELAHVYHDRFGAVA
jgi:hypothetical protein